MSLLRVTTRQQKQVNPEENVILEDVDENGEHIKPKVHQRILGITFSQGLNWEAHLETAPKAMLLSVRKKIGALWLASKYLPKESGLKLANVQILGRLCYEIVVWGTCAAMWVNWVQVVQNRAAQYVTRKPRSTLIRTLMAECGWMSVNQMITYHSVWLMFKMIGNDYTLNLLHRYVYHHQHGGKSPTDN